MGKKKERKQAKATKDQRTMCQCMPIIAERAALGVMPCDDRYTEVWLIPGRKTYNIPYAMLDDMDIMVSDEMGNQVDVRDAIREAVRMALHGKTDGGQNGREG